MPFTPDPIEYAIENAIRQKKRIAQEYYKFAQFFARTFVGFCVGGIFFADKIGAVAYGIAWALCAMLVVTLLNASRAVNAEADRLGIYAADHSVEGREKILKELSMPQDPGLTPGAFREAVLNANVQ